jgi:hypothetical protein
VVKIVFKNEIVIIIQRLFVQLKVKDVMMKRKETIEAHKSFISRE